MLFCQIFKLLVDLGMAFFVFFFNRRGGDEQCTMKNFGAPAEVLLVAFDYCLRPLVPFWHPLGSLWLSLGSIWLAFGILLDPVVSLGLPLGTIWLPFGTMLGPFRSLSAV